MRKKERRTTTREEHGGKNITYNINMAERTERESTEREEEARSVGDERREEKIQRYGEENKI